MGKSLKCALMVLVLCTIKTGDTQEENRDTKQHPELTKLVRNWAQKLGGELWHFGEFVTRRNRVIESFKRTTVIKEDGEALLKDIHERVSNMMKQKVEAVKRIMDIAEQAAKDQKDDDVNFNYQFINAKNLTSSAPNYTQGDPEFRKPEVQELRYEDDSFISTDSRYDERYQSMLEPDEVSDGYQRDQDEDSGALEEELDNDIDTPDEKDPLASQVPQTDKSKLPLYRNRHFYNIPVNTNYSAVHVPSNVYERSHDVISGIIWSEELDKTFKSNYKLDPSLSWQYFGSSTGFMRQFPAMIWSQEPIDLFDCRTRSWFIEAGSSPKDIIILVDRSGSMTGMRREVARHVVFNILDTLGNNDYVNIFTFSNTTEPLVECYDNMLVQANLANVRVFKDAMPTFKTEQIANFSLALVTAFELLETYRQEKKGALCNQAIMLVTDGVQYNYKEIFEKYNWQNLPFVNVRVFTYLIGREVSDVREVKWMACANRGYYVHLSTYAEVREEVLKYIPVMARPMVLNASQKPNPTWSPVYADVTDPKLTNWLWINRLRNRQRERFLAYRRNRTLLPADEQDKKFVHQQKHKQDNYGELQTYRMMTSVSLPVYDKKPRAERVANLLGVAGTDVPIEFIESLMYPYRLGVNGYAFIVTNNGYILTHPDLRPVYQGILKPAYNRVDMIEVEVVDDDTESRDFNEDMREFRRKVVMQERGNITFKVKSHLDDMRRLLKSTRHFYHTGINGTPFSLVIALPHKYGFNRVQHIVENDIHRIRSADGSLVQFFTGNWTIHPNWHYCRYLDDRQYFENPEEEFLHFLKKIDLPGWKWTHECDRRLICKLVADAKITSWFSENITTSSKEENGAEFIRKFGITVAFLSTHSGLTRWQDFPQNTDGNNKDESHFHILHNKAIDEIWYRRAIEQYYVDPMTAVYSVPFDIGEENNTLVTMSHAIFREEAGRKAPAAVIGYQFYQSAFHNLFKKITTSCGDITCKRTCESNELHCLLLDDNGYVIVSDTLAETGYFFGKIRPDIMQHLLDEGVYRVTRMFDYQGLCAQEQETTNPASHLVTPFVTLNHAFCWLSEVFLIIYTQITQTLTQQITQEDDENEMIQDDDDQEEIYKFYHRSLEEYLKYYPCDKEALVYALNYSNTQHVSGDIHTTLIPHTNLVLLIFEDWQTESDFNNNSHIFAQPDHQIITYDSGPAECEIALQQELSKSNYYASCFNTVKINPLTHLSKLAEWTFSVLIYLMRSVTGAELETMMYTEHEEHEESEQEQEQSADADQTLSKFIEKEFDQRLLVKKTKPIPCDHEMFLYNLVHYTERNISNSAYNRTMTDCTRPFIVQKVSFSNMILIVINNLCREDNDRILPNPDPIEVDYNMSLHCYRVIHNDFQRRHYMSCINRSLNESEIKLCGGSSFVTLSSLLAVLVSLVYIVYYY